MPSFRVLIADNHLLMRSGLKQVLSEEYRDVVFGEARTAAEALDQVASQPWDLVVLDIGIPGTDGFQVLGETLLRRPATRVLMLNIHANPVHAERARQLGACGYICKDAVRSELVKAFRNVLAGKAHFDESLPAISATPTVGHEVLSAREYKVLLAFAAGKQASRIAAELGLNVKTVSTYKSRILNKLHLKSTADLVHYVIDRRLS
jgi:two-component system invasion response regulator UvrY